MEKPTATQGLTEIIAEDDSVHKVIIFCFIINKLIYYHD